MICYFDASALVKRYVEEPGSELVRERLQRDALVTSRLSEVEIASALTRKRREKVLSERDLNRALTALSEDFGGLEVVELDSLVIIKARQLLRKHPLRAGDAIQLASAVVLRDEGAAVELLAFDDRLNEAARAEGFRLGGD